jgi:hypothetical protein
MLLKERELDHTKEQFHQALTVPDYMRTKCRERIFFSSFSNALQREELFEDEEDAPKEMSTVTGDLQRCLKMIDSQLEYEFTLLNFMSYQKLAMESYGRYKYLNSKEKTKEDKLKLSIINLIEDLRNQEDEEEDGVNNLSVNSVIKRISIVKSSHYNFDTYLKQLTKEFDNGNSDDFNIDDFLKDVFK